MVFVQFTGVTIVAATTLKIKCSISLLILAQWCFRLVERHFIKFFCFSIRCLMSNQMKWKCYWQESKEYNFENSSNNITIAQLTDFHYDAHYAEGSSGECTDFVCCRNISTVSNPIEMEKKTNNSQNPLDLNNSEFCLAFNRQSKGNATTQASKWGSLHCDSPANVVENICAVVAAKHKVARSEQTKTIHVVHCQ